MVIFYENEERDRKLKGDTRCVDGYINGEKRWEITRYVSGYDAGKYSVSYLERAKEHDNYFPTRGLGTYKTLVEAKKAIQQYMSRNSEFFTEPLKRKHKVELKYLLSGNADDFYTTPPILAGKMLGKIKDWDYIQTVLEPSAGKGDLIDAFITMMRRRTRHMGSEPSPEMIDAVEIDSNLACILKGKGIRVVSDDFLTYQPEKVYDLVLANFPFSEGAEHLLHAIQLQKKTGGQIICLVNAETIRNPYTRDRQLLKQILAEYCASIEFVSDGFRRAERQTDVEVAIVSVCFPRPKTESDLFSKIHKATMEEFSADAENALVIGNEIEALVEHFKVEARMGTALMKEYDAMRQYVLTDPNDKYGDKQLITMKIGRDDSFTGYSTNSVNAYLRALRLKYWKMFLDKPSVQEKMTRDMITDYQCKIRDMQDYDFDLYNIRQVYLDISMHLVEGVKDSLMKLFDEFSAEHAWFPECENNIHYYNGWSTNKAHKVGMKVILPMDGFRSWSKNLDYYYISSTLSDFERALAYLDKGEVQSKVNLERVLSGCDCGQTEFNCSYFSVKFYKKGTAHIKMYPETAPLIDRLNIFCAQQKNWLPPCYGRKHYSDMSGEEKTVIDGFQGEEEYEKIVANPSKFILDATSLVPLLN